MYFSPKDAISTTTTTATKDKKILLHDRPALFYRDGGLPLKILFDETNPRTGNVQIGERTRWVKSQRFYSLH